MSSPMHRRQFLAGAAAATGLGAAGAGCAPPSSPAVRVVVVGSAADKPIWQGLIEDFGREQPDIQVEPVFLAGPSGSDFWSGFFSTVTTRLVGGERYDLVYVPTEGQLLFASRNIMEPLDAYIDRDRPEVDNYRADVDDRVLDQFRTYRPADGHTYYLPFGNNTMCLLYDRRAFAETGIPEPTPDWTWDDMERKAVDLHRATGRFTMAVEPGMFTFIPWLGSNGASILDESWTRATLDTPEALESMRFAASFVERGLAAPPGGAYDMLTAMTSGELAMAPNARAAVQGLRQRDYDPDDFAFVPFPRNTTQGTSVGYGALGMFKASEKKDQAWEFVKFTLSDRFQRRQARTVFQGCAPIRRSAATGPEMRWNSPTGTEHLYEALSYSTVVPGVTNQAQLADPFNKTISEILAGNVDAEEGLEQLQLQFTASLQT